MRQNGVDRRQAVVGALGMTAGGVAAAPTVTRAATSRPPAARHDFQAEKAVVRSLMDGMAAAKPDGIAGVLERHVASDWVWRGMEPFNIQHDPKAVADLFYAPLATALRPLQRRPLIFLAGLNEIGGRKSTWVVQMGHFMGLFDAPFLGVRPTGKIALMRYVEFDRVENGRIAETAMFFDIPQLMIQAGQNPFPPQTGAHLIQPGPMTCDGLMWGPQDPRTGAETMAAIERMLTSSGDTVTPYRQRLARDWKEDMIWWGPCGIGAAYTIDRYILQHAHPFGEALWAERKFNGHLCKTSEGAFGGFFGWPNLTMRNSGGFMGMTGGGPLADMRVVDMYRVQDGKLAENWVFIDILHFLKMQGLDVLKRNVELDYLGGGAATQSAAAARGA